MPPQCEETDANRCAGCVRPVSLFDPVEADPLSTPNDIVWFH